MSHEPEWEPRQTELRAMLDRPDPEFTYPHPEEFDYAYSLLRDFVTLTGVRRPHVYLTPNGGVQGEWDGAGELPSVSLRREKRETTLHLVWLASDADDTTAAEFVGGIADLARAFNLLGRLALRDIRKEDGNG